MTTARRLVLAFAVVAAGTWARSASADSPRVFLVRSNSSTASAKEAMNRIEGELTAEGFHVSIVDSPFGLESTPPGEQDTNAVSIELLVDADEQAAELRVIDRLTNKTVIRHTQIEAQASAQVAQVLAVRAVELLRASLVELLMRRPKAAAAPSPAVKFATERASTWAAGGLQLRRDSTWGFDAGTAGLVVVGIGPALLALVRIRLLLGRTFQLRATLAGLGTSPGVGPRPSGSATVSQEIGLLELVAAPWPDSVVSPVASLGVGPLFAAVDGQGAPGYRGLSSSAWAVALDAGAGVALRLSERFDISLEAHAFTTRPYLTTRFNSIDGPGIDQPSLLGTLTIVGWL